jgi:2-oxoglutarate dehydrogenase E1 component
LDNITESQFYGPNLGYVLELYERYREDPDSVDERTRSFFENWSPPVPGANGRATATGTAGVDVDKVVGAAKYIRSIRDFGHRAAQLDPLGSDPPGIRRWTPASTISQRKSSKPFRRA